MPGISVLGQNSAGAPIVGPGATTWTVNGSPISLLGDAVTGHGQPPHSAPSMVQGSSWMTIGGIPVVCAGCAASCGHTADGQDWFDIPL